MTGSIKSETAWIAEWLDAVQDGSASMSQRRRSSIDKNGGLEEVIAAAKQCDVHWKNSPTTTETYLLPPAATRFDCCANRQVGYRPEPDIPSPPVRSSKPTGS